MLLASKPSVIDFLRHIGSMSFIQEEQVNIVLLKVSLTPGGMTQTGGWAHSNMGFVHAQVGQGSLRMTLKKSTLSRVSRRNYLSFVRIALLTQTRSESGRQRCRVFMDGSYE